MSEQKKSREGPPVWVESLLTDEEYREYCRKYPEVTNPPMYKVANFTKHTKWRFGMGAKLTPEEVKRVDAELKSLREFVISQREKE